MITMKKMISKGWVIRLSLPVLLCSIILLSGCGNFFDESSQDEVKPTTVEDLRSTFFHDGYPYNFSSDNFLFLLTDETQSNGLNSSNYSNMFTVGQPVYCFDPVMFDGNVSFISDENSWKNYYKLIMGCNVALDYVDGMTGSETDKLQLKGQARLLRAFYLLKLATIYCQPYCNNPDSNLGVTLITSSAVDDAYPSRSTLRETYDFIEKELKTAKEELKDYTPTTKYRVTSEVASILLSRLYLYEEKWDECIAASNEAISNGPQLTNFNSLKGSNYNIWSVDGSSEVVWNYNGRLYGSSYIDASNLSMDAIPYSLDSHILALYDQTNDLRYRQYIQNYGNYAFVLKTPYSSQYDGEHGVRMAEVYLNRAEAYTRKALAGDASATAQALADINKLRSSRYATGSESEVTGVTGEDLLQLILDERQREFVWEDGFRWMDIKRNHLSVTHNFIDDSGNTHVYTLQKDDPLYALPIPAEAISRNHNLQQNPR